LSGRGLCDELITRPEDSYRLCCVVVCDLETSRMGAPYIYDISRLRVKYSSTCFGRSHAHHHELNNCSSSLWFYRWSVVVAVPLVVVGPACFFQGPSPHRAVNTFSVKRPSQLTLCRSEFAVVFFFFVFRFVQNT